MIDTRILNLYQQQLVIRIRYDCITIGELSFNLYNGQWTLEIQSKANIDKCFCLRNPLANHFCRIYTVGNIIHLKLMHVYTYTCRL